MYNILVGGAAGQGIETTVAILEKVLKGAGYHIFTARDFMSRVRGGHNFSLLRFSNEPLVGHSMALDGIVAFDADTIEIHRGELKPGGFILCDSKTAQGEGLLTLPMEERARELGNVRAAGSVGIGAVLKLFGISLDGVEEALKSQLRPVYVDVNRQAIQAGYDSVETKLTAEPGDASPCMLVSGNRALALGALAAGLKFYSAYPMSPSTTIMEYLASVEQQTGIVVEQAEDEIAAINMAIGASYAGARAMTGTSGGGFSLMVEALGLSGMAEIPLVAVDVQRPGPVTGLPTRTEQSDLKFVISASQGEFPRMVIALKNHSDAFTQTARAFHLADKYQIPVILLSDQFLGDASATVPVFDVDAVAQYQAKPTAVPKGDYRRYELVPGGISPRLYPGQSEHLVSADSDEHDEYGRITEDAGMRIAQADKRMSKLALLEQELIEPEFLGDDNCELLLLGWGSTYGPIAEAVAMLNAAGHKVGALLFGDIYPLPRRELLTRAARARFIINIEQNATGQLAGLIRETVGLRCEDSILKYDGRQISAEEIVARLAEVKI